MLNAQELKHQTVSPELVMPVASAHALSELLTQSLAQVQRLTQDKLALQDLVNTKEHEFSRQVQLREQEAHRSLSTITRLTDYKDFYKREVTRFGEAEQQLMDTITALQAKLTTQRKRKR